MFIETNYNFIKSGLKTLSGENIVIKKKNDTPHECYIAYNCAFSNTIDFLTNETLENLDLEQINEELGGAIMNKKKKNTSNNFNHSVLDIKKIGNEILNEITMNHPYIYQSQSLHDNDIIRIITELLRTKGYHLTNIELEFFFRFIRDNLPNAIKDQIKTKHSLLEISHYSGVLNPMLNKKIDCSDSNSIDYKQKIIIAQAISESWNGLSSLIEKNRTKSYNIRNKFSENIIHPLFYLLFANKIPGIEDLIIGQDYSMMLEQLRTKNLDKENTYLLFLRMSDMNLLPVKDPNHYSPINNELLRALISSLLKEIALTVRVGKFETKASCLLTNILSDIQMPEAKFPEENFLQAILATFSFKPTLITKMNSVNKSIFPLIGMCSSNNLNPTDKVNFDIPKAVYNIEYPLMDFYSLQSSLETPMLSDTNFSFMGYCPKTRKVIFTYSEEKSINDNRDQLLLNIYKAFSHQKIEANYEDVLPSIMSGSEEIKNIYKNVQNVKVLLTNGVYIISIPREQNQFYQGCNNDLFFKSSVKPLLNLSPVNIKIDLTVNKLNYKLVGALCYDVLEKNTLNDITNTITNTDLKNKLGTLAIIRNPDGTWLEYNPLDSITPIRLDKKIQQAIINHFPNADVNDEEFQKEKKQLLEKILEKKLSLQDMLISEEEALNTIKTKACLLIYSEDYATYKSRIFEKMF